VTFDGGTAPLPGAAAGVGAAAAAMGVGVTALGATLVVIVEERGNDCRGRSQWEQMTGDIQSRQSQTAEQMMTLNLRVGV
jgi:hypothetical protein